MEIYLTPISLLLSLLLWRGTRGITIHYSSPGKTLLDPAGVFKVDLDIDALLQDPLSYKQKRIAEKQFTCWHTGDKNLTRLSIRSLSYDEPAIRTYMQLDEGSDDSSTVLYGETCEPDEHCSFDKLSNVMEKVRTSDKGHLNSVSSWDGTVYFVYTPNAKRAVYFGYRPYLELRQIRDGYTFPSESSTSADAMNVDVFSTLLTRIAAGTNQWWLQAGSTLRVLPAEGSGLVFLTVVRAAQYTDPPRNNTLERFSYALIAARVGGEIEDEAVVLHMSEDTWSGWYSYKLEAEGGLSYRQGTVCWSTADSIRCGTWSPEQPLIPPTDITVVLQPGQSSDIFKGVLSGEVFANVTTGLVLAESPISTGRLVLFFGCLASFEGNGGFGMLVRESGNEESKLISIADKDGSLIAGAMLNIEDTRQCNSPPYVHVQRTSSATLVHRAYGLILYCSILKSLVKNL